ncbi:unnamed protein product [Bursaphelenchus xylophilus]|uniref:(pine wood nematode) hypothetical protein n=1 Tax=Bursaphelenchus xylophilus TaxID=6326 RepID=A0A1I7RPT8_BURXY|nr:unnamed protein product [Bursaphelenchus xylophilus]CAG9096602.1 unnamed protein product [Bursaphelenchus xylophilus]
MDTKDWFVKRIPPQYRAISVITAGVCLQFSYGLVYTFGNILPYLVSYLRWKVNPQQTNGSLMWLQSFMSGLPFAMLLGGVLEKEVGARTGAAIGSAMYCGGILFSFFSIQVSFYWLLVTTGLIASFGQGMAYVNVLTQCQRWMPKNVGFVSGLITAGFGSGAFLLSPIQTKFINPNNLKVDDEGFFTQPEILERVPYLFLLMGGMFAVIQTIGLLFIAEPVQESDGQESQSLMAADGDSDDEDEGQNDQLGSTILSKEEILKSPTFIILFFTLTCNAIWVQTTSGLFKAYAQSFIKDDFFLTTVNSFAAIANCLSRVFWGYIADRSSYQLAMSIACTMGAVLMWGLPFVKYVASPSLFFIWICAMFVGIGATYCLIPYAIHKCFGSANFAITYGFCQLCLAISGVLTALNSQFILAMIGFDELFLITGFTMAISLILTLLISKTKYGANA